SSMDKKSGPASRVSQDSIEIVGRNLIAIKSGSDFEKRIHVATARKLMSDAPRLRVTGIVAASLRPGKDKSDYWQFHSADLLSAYTEWQKASADIAFHEAQLRKIRDLAKAREAAQAKVVDRLVKTVAGGTEAEKDLDDAKLKQLELQILGSKEIYEA